MTHQKNHDNCFLLNQANFFTILIAFGVPSFSLSLISNIFYIFMPKYFTDVIGVPLTAFGVLIVLSRAFDAIIDPLVGVFSDKKQNLNAYARKNIMLISSFFVFITLCSLAYPPDFNHSGFTFSWVAINTFIFFISWTFYTIPFDAIGATITRDYDSKTYVFSSKCFFSLLGTCFVTLLPVLVLKEPTISSRESMLILAFICGIMLPLSTLIFLKYVPTNKERSLTKNSSTPIVISLFKYIRENSNFRLIFFLNVTVGFATMLPATMMFFYVDYILGSSNAPVYLLILFFFSAISVPVALKLCMVYDKINVLKIAIIIYFISSILIFSLGSGQSTAYLFILIVSGFSLGSIMSIIPSMQSDVVDIQEYACNGNRAGEMFGLWSISGKLSAAVAAGVAFPLLDFFGYNPGVQQSQSAQQIIRFLYSGLPGLCALLMFFIVSRYNLNKETKSIVLSKNKDSIQYSI